MTGYNKTKNSKKINFVTLNEFLKKQEFSTFPQEFSTGCGEVLEGLSIALQGYIKINKKQKKSQKMWKSMWKLLETGKKIHCGKLFSNISDIL